MSADLERFEALFSDPDYDGEEIDLGVDPDDPGVWAISAGGPIKAAADASLARWKNWHAQHAQAACGDCGDGYGSVPERRAVETVAVTGVLL